MRKLFFLFTLGVVACSLACLNESFLRRPEAGETTAPPATNWTRLAAGTLRFVHADAAGGAAYFWAEPADGPAGLVRVNADRRPPAVTPVPQIAHNLVLESAVPAFGVARDTVPLRSFATAGGRRWYLAPEGVPRELAVAPDGRTLALTDRGHNAVWVADAADLRHVQATADRTGAFDKAGLLRAGQGKETEGWSLNWAESPVWSPDGQVMYYLSTRAAAGSGGTDLWALDRRTGEETLVCSRGTAAFLNPLGWTPDAHLLLHNDRGDVLAFDPPRRKTFPLLSSAHPVALAPGGGLLLYQKLNRRTGSLASPELRAVRPADGQSVTLPPLPAPYRLRGGGAWAPGGGAFAFWAGNPAEPDDCRLAVFAFAPAGVTLRLCPAPAGQRFDRAFAPAWAEDNVIVCNTRGSDHEAAAGASWWLALEEGESNVVR